jgi:2-(1,2-epoxy-1,2-dihydrophenyl)acetyl-CoA isomerase
MERETVIYKAEDGVGTLTLNRPERRNGITGQMMRDVHAVLSAAAGDDDVRVLVLTGAGDSFCVGADLKHYASGAPDAGAPPETFEISPLLHNMPAVTIAAINGAVAGAGFGWACACDLRLAAVSALFNSAFLDVAVAGDMGGPWSLPRLVGAARARELYLLPGKFDAARALDIGLVTAVYDDDADFEAEVGAVAARLAGAAPLALRGMKQNFVDAEEMGFAAYVALETERHTRITASDDCREAFAAFVEKRTPRFTGR